MYPCRDSVFRHDSYSFAFRSMARESRFVGIAHLEETLGGASPCYEPDQKWYGTN
jgi:hypothetical protein